MSANKHIAIVGAGPAALMAAEVLAQAGHSVDIYDRMASPARKLLIAGRGGLNLTHSEPLERFLTRYGDAEEWLSPAIHAFTPEALRAWCEGLGQETFIGSSGRVFPRSMKAVALLRAWLQRLDALGVRYHPRHHWYGWDSDALCFSPPHGDLRVHADATLFALGGASWPRLGSDGGWVAAFQARGIAVNALAPANCGFITHWSDYLRERFAGAPLKPVAITHEGITRQGEALITTQGIEGGVIYALSGAIRKAIAREGKATIMLDLRPGMDVEALRKKLGTRGNKSFHSFLRSANFSPLACALLREVAPLATEANLAALIKALPLVLTAPAGMARAISTAGGIARNEVSDDYMLHSLPGTFVAGEMLDWEAPTGGYLLQACFSTGVAAAQGILRYSR